MKYAITAAGFLFNDELISVIALTVIVIFFLYDLTKGAAHGNR